MWLIKYLMKTTIVSGTEKGGVHVLCSLSLIGGVYAMTPAYILKTSTDYSPEPLMLSSLFGVDTAKHALRSPNCRCRHSSLHGLKREIK